MEQQETPTDTSKEVNEALETAAQRALAKAKALGLLKTKE